MITTARRAGPLAAATTIALAVMALTSGCGEGACTKYENLYAQAEREANFFAYEDRLEQLAATCAAQGGVD